MAQAPQTRIIIVTGPPASGKTTLAAQLAKDLSLPLICKDGIKEAFLDQFGEVDRATSEHIGHGSWAVLWHLFEAELSVRRSAILEGNFSADQAGARVAGLGELFDFSILQIHCTAAVELLHRRYEERIRDRHPGHLDAERVGGERSVFDPDRYLLEIPGDLIGFDATSFEPAGYDRVHGVASAFLVGSEQRIRSVF